LLIEQPLLLFICCSYFIQEKNQGIHRKIYLIWKRLSSGDGLFKIKSLKTNGALLMKRFFYIVLSFVSALFPAFAKAAEEQIKPEIVIKIDEGTPKYIYKNKRVQCTLKGHSDGCTRVVFYAQLKSSEITTDGVLKKLMLQIGLRDVEIEVSSDLQKESCLFNVVLKHELTHLALHRKILKRFAPEIAKAVLSVAEKMPPPITQMQFDRIAGVLNKYIDRMMREDRKQNALMDSNSAYRYQSEQCWHELAQ